MRKTLTMLVVFCCLLLHLHHLFPMTCLAQPVPNLYVFGDSIFDIGDRTFHETGMKAGYYPYGMECRWYTRSRFTNGRTITEMIASSLNLKLPVPFDNVRFSPDFGVNYASASAGILVETGSVLGKSYCLKEQISFFRETVEKYLRPLFPRKRKLFEYLTDSIYLINIGTSDYIHNYLQPDDYNSSRQYNGNDFAELLTRKLGNNLKDLYNLGARKMVIFQIGPLGCLPYIRNKIKPRSICDEDTNKLVSIFNDKLNVKLKELSNMLKESVFVTARTFNLIKDMVKNPNHYRLKETRWPCCSTQENGTGLCKQPEIHYVSPEKRPKNINYYKEYVCEFSPPPPPQLIQPESSTTKPEGDLCEDRESYLFWDELHLTQAGYRIITNKCLNSSGPSGAVCSPYDLNQLANQI